MLKTLDLVTLRGLFAGHLSLLRVLLGPHVGARGERGPREFRVRRALRGDAAMVCGCQQHRLRATEPRALRAGAGHGSHRAEHVRSALASRGSEVCTYPILNLSVL